jgi:putative ABC transport system permease protein
MMGLRDAFFLAWRSQLHSPVRSALLVGGLAVALFLPSFTWSSAGWVEAQLMRRAASSPIVLGYKGNEFDLVLASLYFRGQVGDSIPASTVESLVEKRYGLGVPVHVGHSANGYPMVGTTLDYSGVRGLRLQSGRSFALLGEVVLGAKVAAELGLSPGDTIRSDMANLYNISGAYPYILDVVGVYAPAGAADDGAVFSDLNTTWLLDGHFHGHGEITKEAAINAEEGVGNLEASAAVFMVNRFDEQTRASFHQHGARGDLPVSSILVFPVDRKAYDQVLGDFAIHETLQAVEPVRVIEEVFRIVLQAQRLLKAYFGLVLCSTMAFVILVLNLSLRLRRSELQLLRRMGCSRGTMRALIGAEVGLIAVGALLATGSAFLVCTGLLRWFISL